MGYDAGRPLSRSNQTYKLAGSQKDQPFRFSTKLRHENSGLSFYGARFYDPGLGRFINRDPIGENGGLNLYGFVGNSPMNRGDAWGLFDINMDGLEDSDVDAAGNNRGLDPYQQMLEHQAMMGGSSNSGSSGGGSRRSGGTPLFRSMTPGPDGEPQLGTTARTLGVRPEIDIPIRNGWVEPGTGGMSVSPYSPMNLPPHRRPPCFGGTGNDPVFSILPDGISPAIKYRPNPLNPHTHGFIEPAVGMTFSQFLEHLGSTQSQWSQVKD